MCSESFYEYLRYVNLGLKVKVTSDFSGWKLNYVSQFLIALLVIYFINKLILEYCKNPHKIQTYTITVQNYVQHMISFFKVEDFSVLSLNLYQKLTYN